MTELLLNVELDANESKEEPWIRIFDTSKACSKITPTW